MNKALLLFVASVMSCFANDRPLDWSFVGYDHVGCFAMSYVSIDDSYSVDFFLGYGIAIESSGFIKDYNLKLGKPIFRGSFINSKTFDEETIEKLTYYQGGPFELQENTLFYMDEMSSGTLLRALLNNEPFEFNFEYMRGKERVTKSVFYTSEEIRIVDAMIKACYEKRSSNKT